MQQHAVPLTLSGDILRNDVFSHLRNVGQEGIRLQFPHKGAGFPVIGRGRTVERRGDPQRVGVKLLIKALVRRRALGLGDQRAVLGGIAPDEAAVINHVKKAPLRLPAELLVIDLLRVRDRHVRQHRAVHSVKAEGVIAKEHDGAPVPAHPGLVMEVIGVIGEVRRVGLGRKQANQRRIPGGGRRHLGRQGQ